jgi:hypothetical protein
MAESKYDFSKLENFLDERFPYPSDCIEVLERIEYTLAHMEQLFMLQPNIANAIGFFEELKLCIEASIPPDKKRF